MAEKTVKQLCREVIALASYLQNNPTDVEAAQQLCQAADQIKNSTFNTLSND